MNVPQLRFEGFDGEWEYFQLSDVIKNKSEKFDPKKNEGKYSCIELEHINQGNGTLNGTVSSENLSSMKNKFTKGSVLYGKLRPYLKKYWFATMDGICSTEIWVLTSTDERVLNRFFILFNPTEKFNMLANKSTGSKMPRADWNTITSSEFAFPKLKEQDKIASFLMLLDKKIEKYEEKVEKLEQFKKGMIQKVFSQEYQFKDEDGRNFSKWKSIVLNEILEERQEKNNKRNLEVHSVAVRAGVINQITHLGRSFAATDVTNYSVVKYGDIVYTKSPTGDFPYGIIKQSHIKEDVIVSPLYGIYEPKNFYIGYILHSYFMYKSNTSNYLHSIVQKGAKNTINITNQTFISKNLELPSSELEQEKIANLFQKIDKKIVKEKEKLKTLENQKKAFMQGMFV